MATPTSAFLRAGESLTPSPVYGSEMKTTPWQFEGRIIEN
jgi:hypothetical protein